MNDLSDSPVLLLEGGILWQFENLSPFTSRQLKEDVASGRVSGEIELDLTPNPPRAPSITLRNGGVAEVVLQVAFLELMWAFMYYWMVHYEGGVQAVSLHPDDPWDEDLHERALHLWQWARAQRFGYVPWPSGLPSPSRYASDSERYFGEKVEVAFQKAVAFMLSHEYAHARLGHLDVVTGLAPAERLELEKDADASAKSALFSDAMDDDEKAAEAWAMLSAILCTLFLYRDPTVAIRAGTHPAAHHRVLHAVHSLDFKTGPYQYYFQFLCRLVLQDAFPDVLKPDRKFEDWDDALVDAMDRLDQL